MPSTTITTSYDIEELDSKIVASLCDAKFYVDITPSVWKPGGEAYTKGAKVKVVNPLGATIRDYPVSTFDISSEGTDKLMEEVVEVAIPKSGGSFIWGTYFVYVELTDGYGLKFEHKKSVVLSAPDKKNKNKAVGCLGASIKIDCKAGKTVVIVNTPPPYNGKPVMSQENDLTLSFPTESELDPIESSVPSFSVGAYEGEYKLSGTVCAMYDNGDNVYSEVLYEVKCSKMARCSVDVCCVYAQIDALNKKLESGCSASEKEETSAKIFDTLRLMSTIEMAAECGEDFSEYVTELEQLLGCSCSCECEGGAISGSGPSGDVVIDDSPCFIEKDVTGNTTTYTIHPVPTVLVSMDDNLDIRDPTWNAELCQFEQQVRVLGGGDGDGGGGGGGVITCNTLNDMFTNPSAPQKNGVIIGPSSYRFLGSNCEYFTPPTGFAVTGADRKSAFGRMEWYDTLVLANAAAAAGETVLIYKDTTEALVVKANVNYQGIGLKKVASLSYVVSSSVNNVYGIQVEGDSTFTANNSQLNAEGSVFNMLVMSGTNSKWAGGLFLAGATIPTVSGSCIITHIFSYRKFRIRELAHIIDSTIHDINPVYALDGGLFLQSEISTDHPKATNVSVFSLMSVAVDINVIGAGTQATAMNVTGKASGYVGVYVHSSQNNAIDRVINLVNVTGISDTDVGMIISNLDTTLAGRGTIANTTNVVGISTASIGLSIGGLSVANAIGRSKNNLGINMSGMPGNNLLIDCIAESQNYKGLEARNARIIGGTFISNLDTAAGNPISFIGQNIGVEKAKTYAVSSLAYAIKASLPINATIANNRFINQASTSMGVDPLIAMNPVVVDAFLNVT